MVVINGKEMPETEGMKLSEYLENNRYNPKRIAVECNGNIIPGKRYSEHIISDGEIIEIVSFVGGG